MDDGGGILGAFPFLLFGGIILVVVVAGVLAARAAAKRREELLTLATRHGWEFSSVDRFSIPYAYSALKCIDQGHSRKASNVVWGSHRGFEFKAFDYEYVTGSGKNREVHHLSVAVMQAKYPLRPILIRPENFGDRLAGVFGFDDIDFEWEDFNRAFYVKSPDKQFAYDVVNQKMMEFLMRSPGVSLEVFCMDVAVHTHRVFAPQELLWALNFAAEFLELLPDYLEGKLRAQQGGM